MGDKIAHLVSQFSHLFAGKSQSGIEIYQGVFDLCNAQPKPHSEQVYIAIVDFVTERTREISESVVSSHNVLSTYSEEWSRFKQAMESLNKACHYLNQTIERARKYPHAAKKYGLTLPNLKLSVEEVCYSLWKDNLWFAIKNNHDGLVMRHVLSVVDGHRNNVTQDFSAVAAVVDSLVYRSCIDGFYEEEFEAPYIKASLEYYKRYSKDSIDRLDMSKYLLDALNRLEEEKDRCRLFVHSASTAGVMAAVESALISDHLDRIHSCFDDMIGASNTNDCHSLFSLCNRVKGGIEPLLEKYQDFVAKRAQIKLENNGNIDAKEYVDILYSHYKQTLEFCDLSFGSDARFVASADKAMAYVINQRQENQPSAPELLSKYCDFYLKSRPKQETLSEAEVEKRLEQALSLFVFVNDKDVFQKFYSRLLAKRLIYGTSASEDAESAMISKLRASCGHEYTSKIQRMFSDLAVSRDTCHAFKQQTTERIPVEMDILVLTCGSWPFSQIQSGTSVNLTNELEKSISLFEGFYKKRHTGRKLSWLHQYSRGIFYFLT